MVTVPGSTGDLVAGEASTQSYEEMGDYEDKQNSCHKCADCLVAVMLQRSSPAPGKFR